MYSKFLSVLVLVGLLFGMCAGTVLADKPAHSGADHGNGKPPDHANAGGREDKWNNDPDDDGRGPDRGNGSVDDEDWNNGCGNDEDRDDDNEGWCGRPKELPPVEPPKTKPVVPPVQPPPFIPPPAVVITPTVSVITPTCKLVLYGWTPEVFESGIDVHDPDNEQFVLAEAHYYLEMSLPMGFGGTVMWYQEATGHRSIVQGFVCNQSELVLYEPFEIGDWME